MLKSILKRRRFRVVTIMLSTALLCSLVLVSGPVLADTPPNSDEEEVEPPVGPFVEGDVTAEITGASVGQTLDVGIHDHCFNDATRTRGFWFTAPTDFVITAVRVPDNCTAEVQNVAVMRFNSAIPTWMSTTNDFTVLGLWRGVAGTGWIGCNIPVEDGDIIGLLGARGTTTMYNSYMEPFTYDTTLAGYPITLRRMGMQYNLNTTDPQNIWTENFYVCRVEMKYTLEGEPEIPVEVGGDVSPVNKATLLTPWIAIAAAILVISGVTLAVRRRINS